MIRIYNLCFVVFTLFLMGLEAHTTYNQNVDADVGIDSLQDQILALDKFIADNIDKKQPIADQGNLNTSAFPNFNIFKKLSKSAIKDQLETQSLCSACNVGMGFVMFRARDMKTPEREIRRNLIFICEFFKVSPGYICSGILDRYSPTIYHIVTTKRELTPNAFCGVMLQSYGCSTKDSHLEWTIQIPAARNVSFHSNWRGMNIQSNAAEMGRLHITNRIKIAQLSDIHVDPLYEHGTHAECNNGLLCCQESHGRPLNKSLQAGHFGDGRKCDAPFSTLELTLKDMAERHSDVELFYMTGDIVPHNLWETNKEDNIKVIQKTAEIIWKYFPTMKIIPVLGNHETHPVNFYSPHGQEIPEDLDTTWIYNATYEAYKQWIPKNQKDLYLKHGYYSVEINPNFRLLVINSNFCYGFNVWQMYEGEDPGNQLKWLIEELHKSEENQQTVHILGHVPPTHDECFRVWSKNFYKIIIRYHHIIKGQFYGHTHFDELKLLYKNGEPINALWIVPSLTPYEVNNFAYRIYHADPTDYQIMDHETWIFDLKKANENLDIPISWFRLYNATEAYQILDLTPKSLGGLIDVLIKDENAFALFYQHYHKISNVQDRKNCDLVCKNKLICGFIKSSFGDEEECIRLNN